MIIEKQQNIKCHFATTEDIGHAISSIAGNVQYGLGSAFPFVWKTFNGGKMCQRKIINQVSQRYRHYILDSGLFTLMFGSLAGKKDEAYLDKWYEHLTDYILHEEYKGAVVEVDCQKVLGVKKAWEYRKAMKKKLPNRIINVFHIEDGQKGLDRLIEYSDYIALSVPELRILKKKEYLYTLASYIKNKKPEMDIHLLGFTEKTNLDKFKFCTTCDSSSWISGVRYGLIETSKGKGHIRNLSDKMLESRANKYLDVRAKYFPNVYMPKNMIHYSTLVFAAEQSKIIYSRYGGNQN